MSDLKNRVHDLLPALLGDLEALVRIQSVSADPQRLAEVEESARMTAGLLAAEGAETEIVRARGRLKAALCQSCVVTDEPVDAHVDEPFDIVFLPEPKAGTPDDEIELGEADCDTVFHDGSAIDLGGALADTLALSLDPYPRSAGADAALKEAGVLTEEQASPFAVLAGLKKSSDS